MKNIHKTIQCCLFVTLICALKPMSSFAQNRKLNDTIPQKDLIDIFKKTFHIDAKRPQRREKKKFYFSVLPVSTSVPGGGKALFTTTTAGIYLADRKTTSLSTAALTPMWNFKSRVSFTLRSNVWLKENKWNILGDVRYLIYPQYTWGLGATNDNNKKVLVDYNYFRFYQTVLKKVNKTVLVGVGYHLDNHIGIKTEGDTIGLQNFTGYKYGTAAEKTSLSSGLSFNVLKDSRGNPINPQGGMYAIANYKIHPKFLGSNDNWQSLYIDVRRYLAYSEKKQNILALWAYYWTITKGNPPYLDLPSIGWDSYGKSGRAYEQNRHRGKGIFYTEAEYRRAITANGLFGFVAFAQLYTVTNDKAYKFSGLYPGAGAGLRLKFNKRSKTNIAFDYGIGVKSSRFYLGLGETF